MNKIKERISQLPRPEAWMDGDLWLQQAMAGFVEAAKVRRTMGRSNRWRPGEPLRLLLVGYNGNRNTGADVRVEEMVRQFRFLLHDDHVSLSVVTLNPELSRTYFKTASQLELPKVFPKALFDMVHEHHGVVACEGSMFKSKFANALSCMMVGALGLAAAEKKLSVGYGGEAGHMDQGLRDMVRRYVKESFIVTRNAHSTDVLSELGVSSEPGTDTAWTHTPPVASRGHEMLTAAGWDGHTPVLLLCPINAFWWPVKPDVGRALLHYAGRRTDAHYSSIYFHADSKEIRAQQAQYIQGLARATERLRSQRSIFVGLVGMERLDRRACEALSGALGGGLPMFVSDEYDMHSMVSLLRQASLVVSSRYHALVTSMPGLVPSVGVTMDERIANLMEDRGQPELCLRVDDGNLGEELFDAMERAMDDSGMRQALGDCVVRNLRRMGVMGQAFVEQVTKVYPEFPFREGLGRSGNPWSHLPPLGDDLKMLVHEFAPEAGF